LKIGKKMNDIWEGSPPQGLSEASNSAGMGREKNRQVLRLASSCMDEAEEVWKNFLLLNLGEMRHGGTRRFQVIFYTLTDPPRGRPVGGGGVHRN
jgi:NaMN:DMB phosphoribosyltransferase